MPSLNTRRFCFMFGLKLFVSLPILSQQPSVLLSTGTLQLRPASDYADQNISLNGKGKPIRWIGRFRNFPGKGDLQGLTNQHIKIIGKLDDSTFVLESDIPPMSSICRQANIASAAYISPEIKISKALQGEKPPAFIQKDGASVKLSLRLYDAKDYTSLQKLWPAYLPLSPDPVKLRYGLVEFSMPFEKIKELAKTDEVAFIDPFIPDGPLLNLNGSTLAGMGPVRALPSNGGYGLTGKGVTVGIGDAGQPGVHPDFYDRLLTPYEQVGLAHSAHVTGTVAGAGILAPKYKGIAPEGKVLNGFFNIIISFAKEYRDKYNMVVTNNSFGLFAVPECHPEYGFGSYRNGIYYDQLANEDKYITHVTAAGNSGEETCAPYPTRYNTVFGGGNSAKNLITTGRTDYNQVPSGSSSSGPTLDGRLKPDITALGMIVSTNHFGNGYFDSYGTSMSSPVVAGAATLLYERYRQLYNDLDPTSALVKALLLNGARDIFTPGPDFRTGFGTVMVNRSLRILDNKRFLEDSISHSSEKEYSFSVPAGQTELKVMLNWQDVPGAPLALKALVNDLDLEVIGPDGKTSYPLVLDPSPANVMLPAKEGIDRTNNTEQVVIKTPMAGNYNIRIKGYSVTGSPYQSFVLAWDFYHPQLQFLSPFKGDVWYGSVSSWETYPVSWEDEGTEAGTYKLEYSTDNGSTWKKITEGIKDTCRVVWWNVPDSVTTTAKLRITKTGTSYVSESGVFSILPAIDFQAAPVAEQCETYFKLKWSAKQANRGIDGYRILLKKGPSMVPIADIPASAKEYVIKNLSKDSAYYAAVVPVKNGIQGTYSWAAYRVPSDGNCLGDISNGDLKLDSIVSPVVIRPYTKYDAAAQRKVVVRIKNMDDQATTQSYNIVLKVNDQVAGIIPVNPGIPAQATQQYSFEGINFDQIGTYKLEAYIDGFTYFDSYLVNDTFRTIVRHVPNPPLSLEGRGWFEDFGKLQSSGYRLNVFAPDSLFRWDYKSIGTGNYLRTSGDKKNVLAATHELIPGAYPPNNQFVIGTFNLADYATEDNVWMEFLTLDGQINNSFNLFVRGNDNQSWQMLEPTLENDNYGNNRRTIRYNLTDSLRKAGQQLSASTQILLGKTFASSIPTTFSIDSFRISFPPNDLELLRVENLPKPDCNSPEFHQFSVTLRNNGPSVIVNPVVKAFLWDSLVLSDQVSATIKAGDTLQHKFSKTIGAVLPDANLLRIEVQTLDDILLFNNKFETTLYNPIRFLSAGPPFNYYDDLGALEILPNVPRGISQVICGTNISWAPGKPKGSFIYDTSRYWTCWATNLNGHYNNNETSYLMLCKANTVGALRPTLSFSMAYDLLDGDMAWLEYSTNGIDWQKLGASNTGTNWYNNSSLQVWTGERKSHWHVATTPLPSGYHDLRIRAVMKTDASGTAEGVAIDDLHVYDLSFNILDDRFNGIPITQKLKEDYTDTKFMVVDQIALTIYPFDSSQFNKSVDVRTYIKPIVINKKQVYFGPRAWNILSSQLGQNTEYYIEVYIPDSEIDILRKANECANCRPLKDYRSIFFHQYKSAVNQEIDSSLLNNVTGSYSTADSTFIYPIPYASGYMYGFLAKGPGEFWMSSGPIENDPLPAKWLSFDANRISDNKVRLQWTMVNEEGVRSYHIQRSSSANGPFETIGSQRAFNQSRSSYTFDDQKADNDKIQYYRIKMEDIDGHLSYSQVRTIRPTSNGYIVNVAPNPSKGHFVVNLYASKPGTVTLRVADIKGRVIYNKLVPVLKGNNTYPIDLTTGKGMVILELNDGRETQIRKLIIQ